MSFGANGAGSVSLVVRTLCTEIICDLGAPEPVVFISNLGTAIFTFGCQSLRWPPMILISWLMALSRTLQQ